MNNIFYYPDKNLISPSYEEVARYLGYKKTTPPDQNVLDQIIKACKELKDILKPQAVYNCFPLTITKTENDDKATICFSDVEIKTKDLYNNLKNCSRIYLIAVTIGPLVDAYIRKANFIDPSYYSICHASGAMYIETVVDELNQLIKNKETGLTHPRYSPGYGDVPLNVQKDFFRLLDCKKIGLSLMDTLIMAPEKSVTAFIGVE